MDALIANRTLLLSEPVIAWLAQGQMPARRNHRIARLVKAHATTTLLFDQLDFPSLLLDLGLLALDDPFKLRDTLGELIRYTYLFGLCVNHLLHHTSLLPQNAFLFLQLGEELPFRVFCSLHFLDGFRFELVKFYL